jgi:anthranilate synthase component 1
MTTLTPSLADFITLARKHNVIPVRREIVVDQVTPVSVYERLRKGEPHAFLLESVEGGERFGRYSFVGRRPHAIFECRGDAVTYREGARVGRWKTHNPLLDLKALFAALKPAELPGLPRFWGGAVGYWDYDTVRFFEKLPDNKPDRLGLPGGLFQLSGEVIVFDRFSQVAQVISNVYIPDGANPTARLKALYAKAVRSIDDQIARIQTPLPAAPKTKKTLTRSPKPLVTQTFYESAVERAKEHIRAGDIIQVVLSQRWELKPQVSAFQVYRALRMVNPSPYMYCLHFPEVDIVGSSPELLVRKEGDLAETRPIAGTRPRGDSEAEDKTLAEELLNDPKERAEHLMLVDLGRNDLGRVCAPGSVKVPELMKVENYSHVMHLVSSVTGRLKPKANAFDLFQACFPAGTLSGAPKIRAMQIIDDLEPVRRGPYGGAVGYFSYTGNMDMAIAIRTLFFSKGKAFMQAGAGIVADSVPAREHEECRHKAAALFAAVRKAHDL